MPPANGTQIQIDDATLIYKNFAGKPSQFNREGDINFCVLLAPEMAEALSRDGFNIKLTNPREDGDEPKPYIQIKARFDNRPPRVTMITSTARQTLDATTISVLDYADIKLVDLIFVPYNWELPGGNSGVSAYLKTMFVTIDEDELEARYGVNDMPTIDDSPV